jgi:hypothetical protein
MGSYSWIVRPLSAYIGSDGTNSDTFEIGASEEVHAVLKVSTMSGTSPNLMVKGQHSIDGLFFEDLTGISFDFSATNQQSKSATIPAFRYVRFWYQLTGSGTPQATFEVVLFVKTLGRSVPRGRVQPPGPRYPRGSRSLSDLL